MVGGVPEIRRVLFYVCEEENKSFIVGVSPLNPVFFFVPCVW